MADSRKRTAALVGNPNTGKTTLFNALSGLQQRTGNYPGVTVETKKGSMVCAGVAFDLIDLPGTYSLAPRSPDEMVAVDVILGHQTGEPRPDVVVSIVDASNLERNLYLTTQALELGVPVIVALNMMDVAESQGVRIDVERLAKQLGVPVVPIQANRGKGLDTLRSAIATAAAAGPVPASRPTFPDAFREEVQSLRRAIGNGVEDFLVERALLDIGGFTEERLVRRLGRSFGQQIQDSRQRLIGAGCPIPAIEARTRYTWIRQATEGCVERPAERPVTWTDRIDRVVTDRIWGSLLFLVVMFAVFQSIFTLATPLMDLIKEGKDAAAGVFRPPNGILPPGPFASLIVSGVIEGVGGILVFLPQILILFAFIAILEDCGYMARAAFLMDKLMSRCGLSGKSFIPMLSSVACAVPGIMAARVIEDRRDRLATILVAPLMSCSARLPVYTLLIAAFLTEGHAWWVPGVTMFGMYLIGILIAPLVAWTLKRTLLRGDTPVFVMEMPAYKRPSLMLVFRRMFDSGWAFVRRAGTVILASMIVVWALLYFPHTAPDGESYDEKLIAQEIAIDQLKNELSEAESDEIKAAVQARIDEKEDAARTLAGEWKRQSILGRVGRWIEPAVRPLGWDWKIGMAAVASFPAREVVVGTLGIIYNLGEIDTEEVSTLEKAKDSQLARSLHAAEFADGPRAGEKVFSVPVALSLMVFFALCCQCASTLAVIRRESGTWRWPIFTFVYMTALAYLGALLIYQVGKMFV